MIITKKCNETQHKILISRIRNNDIPHILEIPKERMLTYRQIIPIDTINSEAAYEQGISFKSKKVFDILHKHINDFYIFETLPTLFSINYNNKPSLNSHEKFYSESLILTDINILSKDVILIEKNESIGNIFLITDNEKLFTNLKIRL